MTDNNALTADELLIALQEEIDNAEDSDREAVRERAACYFRGELPSAPEDLRKVGFADIVSTDVADGVHSVMAELIPTFTNYPVQFEAIGPGDEVVADLESRAVHQAMLGAGSYLAIAQATMSMLLDRAGVLKVYWDSRKVPRYQPFEGMPVEGLPLDDDSLLEAYLDPDTGLVSGIMRTYEIVAGPKIDAVPLSEFLIAKDTLPGRMAEARYMGQRRTLLRGELVAMGLDADLVADLSSWDDREQASHESIEQIMCVDSYYRIDADGDGIAELRRIITGGGTDGTDEILFNEPVDAAPFAVGLGYLGLWTWDGVSLFDKLKEVQDSKTEQLRDMADLMRRASRQRLGAVEYDANIDDVLSSVRGGVVRCKTPSGVFPLHEAAMPNGAFELLGYMDKVRRDKGGGAIDSAQQALQIGGESAHGVERIMSSIEQINSLVARTAAETMIKPAYALMHGVLRANMVQQMHVPGSSGWEATDPRMWQPREKMVLTLGMSSAERQRRLMALGAVIQQQTQALQEGLSGQLVDLSNVYRALIDAGHMAELENPETYWIDPATPAAQQAAQAQAEQAQQAQALEEQKAMQAMQIAQMQATALQQTQQIRNESAIAVQQMKDANNLAMQQLKNELDVMKAALDHQAKMFAQRVNLVTTEATIDAADAQREIDAMQGQEKNDAVG